MASIILFQMICSAVNLFNWLQNHLIPCPFKTLTSIDCPGCGFQRSFIFLLQGNLIASWKMYPPTIPLLCLFLFAGISYLKPFKNRSLIINISAILVGNFIMVVYLYKIFLR
ncbi:DUF2752 domain-containing protein [Pedobacter aquatilis]|uniref:DUF2752 domain-containing protein n=1 Tax=Pedobacter aquatilis TaxID=351343 RepID=UPI00292CB419|nr:DUF2752 domain-containing protein [Pedobacter aquatilis]